MLINDQFLFSFEVVNGFLALRFGFYPSNFLLLVFKSQALCGGIIVVLFEGCFSVSKLCK